MLYEELMMDSSTLLKYRLFKRLMFIGSPNFPIAQIANEMNVNYQQTVIDLTEIDHEIKEIDPNHESILAGAGKINCLNISCTIDEYRYHLLKKSVPFQFILYFLNEEKPTIEEFCERYYTSRSTVSRKIDALKRHLKKFKLRFTYTEAGMVGDERLVRLALFNIIWLGVRGIDWPFAVEEEKVEDLVEDFKDYFPLSRTYLGRWELKYFAAIFYSRIEKGHFAKYDKSYDFLMKDNEYFDFTILERHLGNQLNARQMKGETSFVYFLSHFIPFYTLEDDPTLAQTIEDFSTRKNVIYPMATDFIKFAKEEFFSDDTQELDHPMILGNLLNICFGYYVIKHPFPTIQRLVMTEREEDLPIKEMEERINVFLDRYHDFSDYNFINTTTQPLMVKAFRDVLLPFYDQSKSSKKVIVGVALEHNYLLVKSLYQFLSDLRFVEAEPFNSQKSDDYDLVISSSLVLRNQFPEIPVFLWDHAGDEGQLVALYQKVRKLFTRKNQ